MRLKAIAEVVAHREGATTPQVTPEQQGAEDVAHRSNRRYQKVWPGLSVVDKTGLTEEHGCGEEARDQCADNQHGGCAPAGNKIVVQLFHPTTGVIAYHNVDNQTDENGAGVDIHY